MERNCSHPFESGSAHLCLFICLFIYLFILHHTGAPFMQKSINGNQHWNTETTKLKKKYVKFQLSLDQMRIVADEGARLANLCSTRMGRAQQV
ncbi:hypothetical protein Y032_0048g1610 [Ancylostoma ceylanicum]|uniref:Uncharacterized protein n=1 Tax=Ancylostoma ceylanicum TaxID=53326 RepID=A0A016UBY5_9BILA|nr:hypothetical protein Y032_0048g1610 [Ancylostoma ceylanicum]